MEGLTSRTEGAIFFYLIEHHAKNNIDNYDIPAEKANCLNTEESPLKRRMACDIVLRTHKKHTSEEDVQEVEKILKTFCDMADVECKRNGSKFGAGSLDLRLRVSTLGGHYFVKSFGKNDKYTYNFSSN